MKVKIITREYPGPTAGAYRINCYAKAIQRIQDTFVDIQSAFTSESMSYFRINNSEYHNGIKNSAILESRLIKKKVFRFLVLKLAPFILIINALFYRERADVVLLYIRRPSTIFLLSCIFKIVGSKVFLELNEHPFFYIKRKDKVKKRLLEWFYFKIALRYISGVIVISENLREYIRHNNGKIGILKIPVLYDNENIETVNIDIELPRYFLLHAGSLSDSKDGISSIFKSFITAHRTLKIHGIDLFFLLTHKSIDKDIEDKIDKDLVVAGLKNRVNFIGYVNRQEFTLLMRRASVLIINKPLNIQNKFNFPTRFADYLLSGTPTIVAANDCEINLFAENMINSLVVSPDDIESIAEKITEVHLNPNLSDIIGNNAQVTARSHFDYTLFGHRLIKFFNLPDY